jgi:hypothetical protein
MLTVIFISTILTLGYFGFIAALVLPAGKAPSIQ